MIMLIILKREPLSIFASGIFSSRRSGLSATKRLKAGETGKIIGTRNIRTDCSPK
jgi:hypothetical protein